MEGTQSKKYLIVYNNDDCFYVSNAMSLKHAIIQFFNNILATKENKILTKAFNAMDSEKEVMALARLVSKYVINSVYELGEEVEFVGKK